MIRRHERHYLLDHKGGLVGIFWINEVETEVKPKYRESEFIPCFQATPEATVVVLYDLKGSCLHEVVQNTCKYFVKKFFIAYKNLNQAEYREKLWRYFKNSVLPPEIVAIVEAVAEDDDRFKKVFFEVAAFYALVAGEENNAIQFLWRYERWQAVWLPDS